MEKKSILLVRVSTTRQDVDTQKSELKALALSDGYSEEDMVIIEGVGASAIKLNETYLNEMDELYRRIEEGDIDCVYCWEISRIGRNEEILMRFKNFLISRKIQLVIKNPSLRLLNADGSTNMGIELAFSLFSTMSVQEMILKKERFKRSKAKNKLEGRFNGGSIKIGYRLDNAKHFAEDEKGADVVRKIFHWYVNDMMSLRKIQQRLCDMGIYSPAKNYSTEGRRIGYILRDKAYIGENNYPRIIDDELFNKAQKRLSDRHKDKQTNNVYFCKGLLKDKATGASLIARKDTRCYLSKHKAHPISVNLNTMDYIALFSANILIAKYNSNQSQTNEIEYRLKIEENEKTIKSKKKQIEDIEKMNQRAIEANIRRPEHFPEAKLETLLRQNERLSESLKTAITDIESENTRLSEWLDGKRTLINEILEVSDEKKKEMIDAVIKTIWIEEIDKNHFRITVENKLGYIDNIWFEYSSRGRRIDLFLHYPDGRILNLTPSLKNHRRY